VAALTGRLLTARELADRLGVSVETVLRWARRGKLPAVYLSSRAIRFREDEIDAWLDERAAPRRGVLPPRRTPPNRNATLLAATATEDEE
jgi:excisionase family DNA binding protein